MLYDSIPSRPPRNKIMFEYERFSDIAAPLRYYIREAYIKKIKWMEGNIEVERYEFKTGAKAAGEYVGYGTNEPRYDQKLFETRFLDTLACYKEGILDHFFKFDRIAAKREAERSDESVVRTRILQGMQERESFQCTGPPDGIDRELCARKSECRERRDLAVTRA